MGQFSNRIFGSKVEPGIIKEFKKLEKGSIETQDELGSVQETNYQSYLGERTTFARMWAPLLISGSNDSKVIFHTVNDARSKDYQEPLESIDNSTYINELQSNQLSTPKAGITSVTTKTEGSLGAIKKATIDFTVFNKNDFDTIYQPYFLKPGATIVLDFGWSSTTTPMYDIAGFLREDDIYLNYFKQFIYGRGSNVQQFIPKTKKDGWIYKKENFGVIDVLIGKVVDFNAKYSNDEKYDCSVTITSENTGLLDKEITEENDLKFLFTNRFEELLIEIISSGFAEDRGVTNANFIASDALSAERKAEVIESFYGNLGVKVFKQIGVVGEENVKSGLLYQDLTGQGGSNSQETGYISYGLFEDLFLNTLISENNKNDIHQVNFNSKETLIRYSDKLVERQQVLPNSDEELSVILYPESYEYLANGYNSKTTYKEVPSDFNGNLSDYKLSLYKSYLEGTVQLYGTKVIPLRDVFISIKTITKAFEAKQNVNDALLDILSSINKDSYDILNLQIVSLDSFSSVGVVDLNLHPPYEETLTFDITQDSIVSNLDLTFMLPKGGMSSMIAIGENTSQDGLFSDDANKDALKYLELLGADKEKFGDDVWARPLPLTKDPEEKVEEDVKRVDFQHEKTSQIVQNMELSPSNTDFKTIWMNSVNKQLSLQNQNKTQEKPDEKKLTKISRRRSKLLAKDKRLKARSKKDYYGKLANQEAFGSSETSPGALIRGELGVTVFGNTYLNIGDYITINYLPKHISDKLIYMITGLEQKVGDNWETTYTTIAILKPQFKKLFVGKIKDAVYDSSVLEAYLKKSNPKNSALDRASQGEGLGATEVRLRNQYVNCKKIKSRFTKDVIEEVSELGKSNNIVKQLGASFIVNEFQSVNSLEDLKFVMSLQEVVLKYLYGRDLDTSSGAVDRKTDLRCFRNPPNYKEVQNLYSPRDGGKDLMTDKSLEDFPTIFLIGLVEDADDDNDIADDNPNAAGEYIDGAQTGKTPIANVTVNRVFSVLEHLAKRKYSKQFFDNYVKPTVSSQKFRTPGDVLIPGGNNKGKLHHYRIPNLNELEIKSGMILSSFGFQLSPFVQSDNANPVTSYLFEFRLPFQGKKINNLVFLPEYFFTSTGISVDTFVDEVATLYADNTLDKIFLKEYDRQFTEAVVDHATVDFNVVDNIKESYTLGSRWVKRKLGLKGGGQD